MKIAPVAELKSRLSAYLKACQEGPVIVTRNGRAVAALIAVEDDDLEQLVLAHTPKFQAILDQQLADEEKRRRSDFVVSTGLGKRETLRQLLRIVRLLRGGRHEARRPRPAIRR